MPRSGTALAVVAVLLGLGLGKDLEGLGRNSANLIVLDAKLVGAVEQRVDVEGRVLGLLGGLAETLGQDLLQLVGQVVLLAEEDDTALGD